MKTRAAAEYQTDRPEVEIVRADKGLRQRLLIFILLIFMAGGAFMWWFSGWSKSVEPERALHVIVWSLIVLFLGVIPIGLYIIRLGSKIAEEERIPPLGMKVIKDTEVVIGKTARRRGRILQACGLLIIVVALIGAWLANRFPKALLGG